MAIIKVDHRALSGIAGELDSYVSNQKRLMREVDSKLVSLGANWSGKDYEQIKREWTALNDSGSASERMIKSIDDYAKSLKEAAARYKEAQARAINRANRLCR